MTLAEVCEFGGGGIQTGPFGSQLHARDYVLEGIPSIMPQNIGDNRVVPDGIARISADDATRLSRYLVKPGDIVYSRRGDVEKRALIRESEDGWLCGTGCLRVRLGEGGPDPVYASYYLGHPVVRAWVVRHAHGATMPNLNTTILGSLPFVVPPKRAQEAIASVLGALDDKIELNRRMNETLEGLVRAVFVERFLGVDHRPLWATGRLSDILTLRYGKALPKRRHVPGDVPVYGSGGIYGYHDTALVNHPTVIVGRKGTVGSLRWESKPCHPADTVFYVEPTAPLTYCYYLLQTLGLEAMNTDAAVPGLNRENAYRLEVPVPSPGALAEFDTFARPIRQRIDLGGAERDTLAGIRDALLPKLISGELRVPDAERVVGEVV